MEFWRATKRAWRETDTTWCVLKGVFCQFWWFWRFIFGFIGLKTLDDNQKYVLEQETFFEKNVFFVPKMAHFAHKMGQKGTNLRSITRF